MLRDYDVTIVGAGMVGASLACALAPSGLRIAIIEAVPLKDDYQPSYDDRGLTLSPSSKRILEHIDVWGDISSAISPIKKIHVSEQGRFGFTHLDASETNIKDLGYVVIARVLGEALHEKILSLKNISLICPAELKSFKRNNEMMTLEISNLGYSESITTGLLVAADGSQSLVRRLADIRINKYDFGQTAIVANVTTQKLNQATAYERFTHHGPIAFLPIGKNRSVLIFTIANKDKNRYMSMADAQFIDGVETEFGRRLGKLEKIGQRRSYPIMFIEAVEQYHQQLILLGNAAHSIHPNSAQGFNLGLRDVAGLAECIFEAIEKGLNVDDISILEKYVSSRLSDQKRVIQFTDRLASSFYNKSPLLVPARCLAMLLLDTLPIVKKTFIQQAMGIAGLQPRIVRGQHA